ncbi:hypothetical protein ACH5RR_021321 [Cinchona calisaya]|uniref:Protein kinase domain-containing protein n=1 Tax=Cinchona calisaya TaxID=153742 RepID=A0ABD2ZKS3_9GENT
MRERDCYELDKETLIREMKRIRDEDGSRFNNFQISLMIWDCIVGKLLTWWSTDMLHIFRGLVYLNKRVQRIIHYDQKAGNVLFDEFGIAKVTDFGLSKIVEDDVGSQGTELTSHGAGIYCWHSFVPNAIWKMAFGSWPKPRTILCEDTIIKARKVDFPSRPAVSNEAKDFIRGCLTYDQAERPDVLTIAQDPYLTYTKK